MFTREVTQDQILEELRELEQERWPEVLDFIGYLRATSGRTLPSRRQLTARDLLQSGLVGLWADREDIGDSLTFARELRRQAERRQGRSDDPA